MYKYHATTHFYLPSFQYIYCRFTTYDWHVVGVCNEWPNTTTVVTVCMCYEYSPDLL